MPGVGSPAPNFSGHDFINDTTFTLAGHAGEIILLCFSAYWCPHCTNEVPRLQNIWQDFAGHGVQVILVHVDGTESDGLAWLTGLGATFPAIQDTSSIFSAYSPGYGGIPHLYIIGRDMVIRKDLLGEMSEDTLRGHLMDVVYMREPIDLEMVMDVSDSMNSSPPGGGDPKLEIMKTAATIITDFLKDHGQTDDRMGLVWFTDDASEYQNTLHQKLLPIPGNWADLRSQINAHGTGMYTAMGAGLQTAFDTLTAGSANKRFAILCTDGMQNIEPKVTQVGSHFEIIDSGGWVAGAHSSVPAHPGVDITSYDTCIHTIGIGIQATYAGLLQDIANATGGFYRGTNDPENDLDLIYLLDLCNCMAGGSPAVAHHSTGRLDAGECEAVEYFYLNRSARKITVILSWNKSEGGDLTFWLYGPDGSLLHLGQEMKLFENHCLATVYLPVDQNGVRLTHVGRWRMVIRGETLGSGADYHAFVIAEDREVHFHLEPPKRIYEVGDILPIRIKLTESQKPVVRVKDIIMETAQLRVTPAELCSRYKVSAYELAAQTKSALSGYKNSPLAAKLKALAADPAYKELLKPVRKRSSLLEGSLECQTDEKEIVIPVTLKQPGLVSYKVSINCETPQSGPIYRTDMVTVYVGPGKADPGQTKVSRTVILGEKHTGALIIMTPKNEYGQLLGPGLGHEFSATDGRQSVDITVTDQLDGTYRMEIVNLARSKGETPISIQYRGKSIWKGELKGE
ncbi:redoxin domain-containing protein [Pelotomaculum terephthalicicum JT]|uniref:redoxin domain-containing protein n=1 Tax=Pelotomaculum terephthalicicum TaxID=206393 RepID=UPI0009D4CE40|nr:redoxin domain-containing protein [Pelotomaculum terephthalicicum]MCG9969689.1 redoxin domain-containing protein [Pelotomaculum terephthalicicum JT]OPY59996.1 MAG: Thiol-disulfide oxidoreductase ResA [Pelotomaculum sp. PtaU1.Bin065]